MSRTTRRQAAVEAFGASLFGAATLRSQGWKKRGKNYMKQWTTRQGIVVAHLQAAKDGSYVWDVKLHTTLHRGYFADFRERLLAQGTAPNATKAAYRATVAGLGSPFLSRARAKVPEYKAAMVHGSWIVADTGTGKVVAEGLRDVHAARQWIKDHTPEFGAFGYDAAQQWAYDKAHGGTRWGPRSMGGGYDTFGARRTELAWYGKGKLYGWRIYREKGGLTIVPSRAGLRETTGHIAPSFKALPYARAPKAVRAAYDKLKRGGLT